MEVKGTIKFIGQTEQVTDSFSKRDLVVTTDEQYPQHILIEFGQDKCDLLNDIQAGMEVTVHINLRGREWTNPQGEVKYFNSLNGWKVDKPQMQAPQQNNYQQPNHGFTQQPNGFQQQNQGFQQPQQGYQQQGQPQFNQNNQGFNNNNGNGGTPF